jgi:hypothetical protein
VITAAGKQLGGREENLSPPRGDWPVNGHACESRRQPLISVNIRHVNAY